MSPFCCILSNPSDFVFSLRCAHTRKEKATSLAFFSTCVCYLRELHYVEARDFAMYTESNFADSVGSDSVKYERLCNTN